MDKNAFINNLLANYGKYGVTRAELEPIIVLSCKLDAPVPCRLDAPDFGFVC